MKPFALLNQLRGQARFQLGGIETITAKQGILKVDYYTFLAV